jgi:hypothetical protein
VKLRTHRNIPEAMILQYVPLLDGHGRLFPVSTRKGTGQGNERETYTSSTSAKRKCGIAYQGRRCAVSHDTAFLAQPGRTGGMFLGQQLTPSRKTMEDKSLLLTR